MPTGASTHGEGTRGIHGNGRDLPPLKGSLLSMDSARAAYTNLIGEQIIME